MEVMLLNVIIIAVFIGFEMFDKFDLLIAILISGIIITTGIIMVYGILPIKTLQVNLGMPSIIEDQVTIRNLKSFIVVKEVTKRDYFINKDVKYLFYENKPEVASATFIVEFSR